MTIELLWELKKFLKQQKVEFKAFGTKALVDSEIIFFTQDYENWKEVLGASSLAYAHYQARVRPERAENKAYIEGFPRTTSPHLQKVADQYLAKLNQ
jgi:hypothetical protein